MTDLSNGSPTSAANADHGKDLWIWLLVFAVTFAAYHPALHGSFIWDDDAHVTAPDLRPLSGLFRIWFEPGATQQYYPLLHSAFWLEHRLWGDAVLGYHLVNVLLHATAACLFGTLLRRLAVPGAWLAALLFALHPVGVESVAWISEQKNTLSAVFFLAASLGYLRFAETRRPRHYALAAGWFLLALLTKSVTATLPAALLVIFWWRHGRLAWQRDVRPLLPWFVVGTLSGLFTAHFERVLIGAQGEDFTLSLLERGLLAGRVVWFYAGKLVWPADLTFIYARWNVDASAPAQWLFPLATLALLGALVWWSRRSRGPLAAALLFGGLLLPVLSFVNVYPFLFSYVADHFQYLASLAVFALGAAGLTMLAGHLPRGIGAAGLSVLLAGLGTLTWRQAGMYRDPFTLYETTLARNPECWMAHNNLAMALADTGRVEEAVPHLEKALKLRPAFAQALSNLGDDLTRLGRPVEALPHLHRALQLQPRYVEAHNNLGAALMALGRTSEALTAFARAAEINPGFARARCNLGLALAQSGRTTEAIAEFAHAVRLAPSFADAELNWGVALTLTDRFAESVPHFERALALAPAAAEPRNTYGQALARNGRTEDALAQFRAALELNPGLAAAHLNAAHALRQLDRIQEADEHFAEAQRLGAGR